MAGYVIAQLEVTDPAGFEEYRNQVSATVAAYGGKYIVRGSETETVEGSWSPKRLVILEFESVEQAKKWYYSAEYEGPKALRHKTAQTDLVIVEGL
jgi:uncharacterized protein (DUF1330 family)